MPLSSMASELLKVNRVNARDVVQLYFKFDTPPRFETVGDKKRVNIIFYASETSDTFKMIEPDNNIVKILSRKVDNRLIISFFFRYQPQNYQLTQSGDNNIVFETLLGNQYTKSYQNLADRLKGLTVVDRTTPDFTNPYTITPYVKDWRSFFIEYETPISINLSVKFTVPPFPIIALLPPGNQENIKALNEEALTLANDNLWEQLAAKILDQIATTYDLDQQKILALTYGEALLRKGDFTGAYKQLYLLNNKYPNEIYGTYAKYLLILLRALYEDPFIAEYEFRSLEDQIPVTSQLAPYFFLSRIESALASHELKRLNKLLQQDNIALPAEVEERVKIRQADYWFSINQNVKAFAAYKLLENSKFLETQPFSYNGYCSTLYAQKKFDRAAIAYRKLAALADDDKNSLSLISYRENMAKLRSPRKIDLIDAFSQIESAFPSTNGGFLADIKKNDLLLLENTSWTESAQKNYNNIALSATDRAIRGEAYFKGILLDSFAKREDLAVKNLMKLLREFKSGDIVTPAQALLIDLLPKEIERLVSERQYMEALVLAKQNRLLFQNSWIKSDFLVDIAKAYHRIGIFDEAQKLYLYLIEIMPVDKREQFFLPMIQATFDYGNFILVEDYAAQYTYNYPKGKFLNEVLYLRLQALIEGGRLQEALLLIPTPLPEDITIRQLAAKLFFRLEQYDNTATIYTELAEQQELSPQERFIFAESLYSTNQFAEAESSYEMITKNHPFYDQTLYRLAQLAKRKGEEKKAYDLFKTISEKGKNIRWKQYAERELQYQNLKDKY